MPSFNLNKGSSFKIEKAISHVIIGLGWDVTPGKNADVDAHAFGCLLKPSGEPTFYNHAGVEASHALTYANKASLQINANKSFQTPDGSLHHSGDDRSGSNSNGGDDETITVLLDKLPVGITEVSIWVTIHEPNGGTFGLVSNAYVRLVNQDNGSELCRYNLQSEFANARSIQVGSLYKKDNAWTFAAIGAGLDNVGLGEILGKLS